MTRPAENGRGAPHPAGLAILGEMAVGPRVALQDGGSDLRGGIRVHRGDQVLDEPGGGERRVALQVDHQIGVEPRRPDRLGAAFGPVAAVGAGHDDLRPKGMGRVGGTTAVMRADHTALYFSKEVLPYVADLATPPQVWHHVGVYAYTAAALRAYAGWDEGPLERAEGLEQLRFLENGMPITCVPVEGKGRVFWELNNPVDVARIEDVLKREGIA
jgi:hypothetical protein